jgi:hypothetical protein
MVSRSIRDAWLNRLIATWQTYPWQKYPVQSPEQRFFLRSLVSLDIRCQGAREVNTLLRLSSSLTPASGSYISSTASTELFSSAPILSLSLMLEVASGPSSQVLVGERIEEVEVPWTETMDFRNVFTENPSAMTEWRTGGQMPRSWINGRMQRSQQVGIVAGT